MATHEVSVEMPQKFIRAEDVKFQIKSDGNKIGTLLVSKGNIEWIPAKNSVKKRRLSWERFSSLMSVDGKVARIRAR